MLNQKELESQTSLVLRNLTASATVKKYIGEVVNLIVDFVKMHPRNKRDSNVQIQILSQLKLLNENIMQLNINLSKQNGDGSKDN